MPKMHLKQLALLDKRGIIYSVCGPFTKNNERIQKLMQAENTNVIYKNDLDKACFQHDMTYDIYKDLAKRTQPDKVLRDKALEIANDPNCKLWWLSKRTGLLLYKRFD